MTEVLRKGDKGVEVKELQQALKNKGYDIGGVDGIFGTKTEVALKAFQKQLGVAETGELGPWVRSKLITNTSKKTIVITAGHSNTDHGAVNGKRTEAQIVTEMRNIISKVLRSRGYIVLTDGEGTINNKLNEAVKLVPLGAVAIDIHLNAAANKNAGGIEALAPEKYKAFCKDLCGSLSQVFGNKVRGSDGGWKPENSGQHSRLAYVSAGGIILETFFISNDKELKTYDDNKSLVSAVIAKTIEDHI